VIARSVPVRLVARRDNPARPTSHGASLLGGLLLTWCGLIRPPVEPDHVVVRDLGLVPITCALCRRVR
jgi:hypothetical protein